MNNNFDLKIPKRLRRPRKFQWSRNLLLKENQISKNDFILALFICEGSGIKESIELMPEVFIFSIDELIKFLKPLNDDGFLNAIMLFPRVPCEKKSENAEEALDSENLICRAIKEIRKNFSINEFGIIVDIALDPYTLSGHDGITDENQYVLNDKTVEILGKQALNFALAGADVVAPSDMMDGRIGFIRKILDENNFSDVQIMSYAVKFASSCYSPFRSSIGSSQKKPLDKSSYQIDPANSSEAEREILQDIEEGADSIIIKPSLFYMDIMKNASEKFNIPLISYFVSGEYAMIYNGIKSGVFQSEEKILYETYIGLKRAGAKAIITYQIPKCLII
jgi:porphobilinogen synthase